MAAESLLMSWFAKLIGTDEAFKVGAKIVDKAFYTAQERSEDATKVLLALQDQYTPRAISRRILAFLFCSNFIFIVILCVGLACAGEDKIVNEIIKVADHFKIGWITMSIVIFYFGKYLIPGGKK